MELVERNHSTRRCRSILPLDGNEPAMVAEVACHVNASEAAGTNVGYTLIVRENSDARVGGSDSWNEPFSVVSHKGSASGWYTGRQQLYTFQSRFAGRHKSSCRIHLYGTHRALTSADLQNATSETKQYSSQSGWINRTVSRHPSSRARLFLFTAWTASG